MPVFLEFEPYMGGQDVSTSGASILDFDLILIMTGLSC